MKTSRCLPALLAFLLTTAAGLAQERTKYLSALEILQWLERSTTSYTVLPPDEAESQLDDPYQTMIPRRGRDIYMETVTFSEDGQARLERVELSEEADAALEEGEKAFTKGRLEDARAAYERGRDLAPHVFKFQSYIGDTYFREREYETALRHYDSAIALNPRHYQAHYFRGSALLRLGRLKESLASFVRALALNPRHPMTLELLTMNASQFGIVVRPTPVLLHGAAWRGDEGVQMAYNGEAPWLAYAAAKALYLGEPDFREQLGGTADTSHWSSAAEIQAYIALGTSYLGLRESPDGERDPQLDRLVKILENGDAGNLAVWEFGSRLAPHIMMLQPEEQIVSMEKFIRAFIVVDDE